jgi:hypothetical protein
LLWGIFHQYLPPHILIERAVVESETGEIMNIAEAAF